MFMYTFLSIWQQLNISVLSYNVPLQVTFTSGCILTLLTFFVCPLAMCLYKSLLRVAAE